MTPAEARTGRIVHPIERESYARLRATVRTDDLPPDTRAVVERVIHTTADTRYLTDLVCDETTLAPAAAALAAGAPLVVDARMVAAGITSRPSVCLVDAAETRSAATRTGQTRSAAAFRIAADQVGPGAVWAVGNAPTALFVLLELDARPALVVGTPVGFVGAVEAKAALRASGLPAVTNLSARGGSPVAAAAVNALLYADLWEPPAETVTDVGPNPGSGTGADPARSGSPW